MPTTTTTTTEKATTDKKMYTLKTLDNWSFEVDESVAMMFDEVRETISDGSSDTTITFEEICGPILGKVIEYCLKHMDGNSKKAAADDDSGVTDSKDDLTEWEEAFLDVNQATLLDIIVAANLQRIKGLLDLAYAKLLQTFPRCSA